MKLATLPVDGNGAIVGVLARQIPDGRGMEIADVVVVLADDPGISIDDAIAKLRSAGLSVSDIDANEGVIEGTVELCKMPNLRQFPFVDISDEKILKRYAEIEAYSQGWSAKKLPAAFSARKLSHNDLWIAAAASTINATLVTTDKDFDHLHGVKLRRRWIDPSSLKGQRP